MASFFNLVLDTLAPAGVSIKLNNGARYATAVGVTAALATTDTDTTGYQMKLWGDIESASTETAAAWENFSATKELNLTTGDGKKTVYVKIRDDVGNESTMASTEIILDMTPPVVTVTGPDKSKISKVDTFNVAAISFTCDVDFVEYKVKVVPAESSLQDAGVLIGTEHGSTNMSGTGEYSSTDAINCTINGADLEAASAGDGTKIVKVFVKDQAGNWSVA